MAAREVLILLVILPYPYEYKFQGGSLTEIPITTLPTKFPLNRSRGIAEYYFRNVNKNMLLRGLRKLFYSNQPEWLRPTPEADIAIVQGVNN